MADDRLTIRVGAVSGFEQGLTEPLVAIATDRESPYTAVELLYKQPVRTFRTVEEYRRSVVESLYNGMLNERFLEMTRRPDAPFAQAGSGQGRIVRSKEVYQLQAVVSETGIERGLEALLTEAERVARHGFTPSELERQKANVLRSMERAYAERRAGLVRLRIIAPAALENHRAGRRGTQIRPGQGPGLTRIVLIHADSLHAEGGAYHPPVRKPHEERPGKAVLRGSPLS